MPSQSRIDHVWEKILKNAGPAKHTGRKYIKYAAAAACLVVVVFAVSPAGRASANALYRHIFPDRDNAVITMEGSSEKVNYSGEVVEFQPNSGLADYGVYIDKNMYSVEKDKDTLIVTPLDYTEQDMKDTPVYMTITQTTLDKASSLASELDKIKAKDPVVCETGESDLTGFSNKIHAQWFDADNYQWDGDVESIYIADNGKGGSFIVTIHYFADCEEGHASRMADMANSITVFED